jgi:hypothetical protein
MEGGILSVISLVSTFSIAILPIYVLSFFGP